MTFAENLKNARMAKGMTLDEVSSEYNSEFDASLTPATLSRYENGRQEPSVTVLKHLCTILDVTSDELLGLENSRVARIPRLGEVDSVDDNERATVADIIGWEEVAVSPKEANHLMGIKAPNSNMFPTIKKDDVILARKDCVPSSGDLVLVALKGGNVICRRLLNGGEEGMFFLCDSGDVPPIFFDAQEIQEGAFTLVGKVVEIRRRGLGRTNYDKR